MAMPSAHMMEKILSPVDEMLKEQNADKSTPNMTEDQVKSSMGGVLSFLKGKLPAEDFGKIEAKVPGAKDLIKATEDKPSGGGLRAMFGGKKKEGESSEGSIDTVPELIGNLQEAGVDPSAATGFLSTFSSYLNKTADVDVSEVVGGEGAKKGIMSSVTGMLGLDGLKASDLQDS